MDSSSLAKAHSRRLAVAFTLLGLFVFLAIAAIYRQKGIATAAPLALTFLTVALYFRWLSKRAAAWRSANPTSWNQSVPFSVFGGLKTTMLFVSLTTFVMVVSSVALHLLRI